MIFHIDLSNIESKEDFHKLLRETLPLPEYYGDNLDSLNDILWDEARDWEIEVKGMENVPDNLRDYMEAFKEMAINNESENPRVSFTFLDGPRDDQSLGEENREEPKLYAILMAGGRGSRMGGLPKQFRTLGDMPLILHSLKTLIDYKGFNKILIPVPEEYMENMNEMLQDYEEYLNSQGIIDVIAGGKERWDSLDKAINHLEEEYQVRPGDIVLTHDAARPFITKKMIRESVEAAKETGAATCAIPATDTIATSFSGEEVDAVFDRGVIYQIQTPQTFDIESYHRARMFLEREESAMNYITDVAGLFRYGGFPVDLIPGDRWNIKVTFQEDFKIAEAILDL